MLGVNMNNVDAAGNYQRPKAGGYVIEIKKVFNDKAKERLDIEYDFYEGEFKGYYADLNERRGFWLGKFTKSYKEKALPFLKVFLEAVVNSNKDVSGLIVGDFEDVDETQLPGKLVGMVVGERKYLGNDGTVKQNLDNFNATFVSVDDIRNSNYTVPDLRVADELQGGTAPEVVDMSAPADYSEPPF